MTITIKVVGIPRPQGSKRYVGRMIEDNPHTAPWRCDVRSAAMLAMQSMQPLAGPLSITITFVMPRPRKHYRTGKHAAELRADAPRLCCQKPDIDKLSRAVLDAIKAIVWVDDCQACTLLAMKIYGDQPGCEINVSEVAN